MCCSKDTAAHKEACLYARKRTHIGVLGPPRQSLQHDEEPLQESELMAMWRTEAGQTHSSEIEGALDIGLTQTVWSDQIKSLSDQRDDDGPLLLDTWNV